MTDAQDVTPPPRERKTLVQGLVGDLCKIIEEGVIPVGGKLPSEATLTVQYGVSRTVVREAVAALRSQGYVEPRQGAGVFVLANRAELKQPFGGIDLKKLSGVLEMMELRIPVEAEAAALAAARRSPAQEVVIFEAIDALENAIAGGQDTAKLDLAFHVAIARATNNPRFELFLEALGVGAIPRVGVSSYDAGGRSSSYDKQLNSEHSEIAKAIAAGDGAEARSWMRKHLESGLQRYRDLRASAE